jgi:hypothetical protein
MRLLLVPAIPPQGIACHNIYSWSFFPPLALVSFVMLLPYSHFCFINCKEQATVPQKDFESKQY